jgi:thymidylate synthase (FAD)
MKIVKPTVTKVHATGDPARVTEAMGRICYQSDHKVLPCGDCGGEWNCEGVPRVGCYRCDFTGTDEASAVAFVKKILSNGHESVLEHVSAGFKIVTDRGVTHELVRHRIASFSQESTRYCNYGNERFGTSLTFIEPPGIRSPEQSDKNVGRVTGNLGAWCNAMERSESIYMGMISSGVAPQIARSVLPNSLKSEIGMTCNAREWRHFLRLRLSPKAHPQMREVARMIQVLLSEWFPVAFEEFAVEVCDGKKA